MQKSPLTRLTQAGFTMVELLIVLTIITIAALLVANNIEEAVGKARDIERRNDINEIQRALETYWHEHEAYPEDLNSLDISFEYITDPSGNLIQTVPASQSANKPDSGYETSRPEPSEDEEDEADEEENLKPSTEYTYAAYDCRMTSSGESEEAESEEADEEDESEEAEEATNDSDGERKCHKYVLYSWLEKAAKEEIPYERENLHNRQE